MKKKIEVLGATRKLDTKFSRTDTQTLSAELYGSKSKNASYKVLTKYY